MADILIRGIEMPTKCGLCPMFCDDFNDYCSAAQRSIPFDAEKPDWCPLLSLPEGHGRLIDADALFEVMGQDTERWLIDDISYIETDDAISAVYKAPTIVPAEGGTEDA